MRVFRYISFLTLSLLLASVTAEACTSAIVGRDRSASGSTLLWKHRDTGSPHNYIARHAATDSTFEYIALHNAADTLGLEAWTGMNRAGLAVMNTASYNLAPDTASVKDREGIVMTLALQRCRTVADFGLLLDSLPRPMGVQANFGVIDASGTAAWFETNDNGYTVYRVEPADAIVRTNYSHSGAPTPQLGLARETTARRAIDNKALISPSLMLDTLSMRYFDSSTGADLSGHATLVDNGDYIPRYTSTASIVIEAVPSATGDGSSYIMWTRLGYPPCADLYKVTFDNIPADLTPGPNGITPAEHKADNGKTRRYDGSRSGRHRIITL